MRNIRQAAVGGIPTDGTLPQWNVTPEVITAPLSLAIVDQSNTTYNLNNQTLSFSPSALASSLGQHSFLIGVAKTNLNMSMVQENETVQFGFTAGTGFGSSSGLCYMIAVLAPGDKTAGEVKTALETFLQTNTPPFPNDVFIFASAASFLGNQGNSLIAHVPSQHTTTPPSVVFSEQGPHPVPQVTGKKVDLLVRKTPGTVRITMVQESADGSAHQIFPVYKQGDLSIEDPVVFPDTTTLFYVLMTVDMGSGYQNASLVTSINRRLSSNSVAGTLFENDATWPDPEPIWTDADWDAAFPRPFATLQSTNVTQAVLPVGTKLGQQYRTYVDPAYSAPYPVAPYGVELTSGQVVAVDKLSPVNLRAIYDQVNIPFVLNPITQAMAALELSVSTQFQAVNDSLTSYATAIQEMQTALQSVGKNVDEYVIYVRGPNAAGTAGLGNAAFATFDEAYEHAITLAPILRKRIVFDDINVDSNTTIGFGNVEKNYNIVANNIVLSTHRAMREDSKASQKSPADVFNSEHIIIRMKTDGFILDNFQAAISDLSMWALPYAATLTENVMTSSGLVLDTNFRIGNNCSVWFTSNAVLNVSNGGSIPIGNKSYVSLQLTANYTSDIYRVNVTRGYDSFLDITGTLWDPGFSSPTLRPCVVYAPRDNGIVRRDGGMLLQCGLFYTGNRTSEMVNGAYIVRNIDDFMDSSGYVSPGTYYIAGEVDISSRSFVYPYDGISNPLVLLGSPGSKLITSGGLYFPATSARLIIRNVDLIANAVGCVAITNNAGGSSYDLAGCVIEADIPFTSLGGTNVSFRAKDVTFAGLNGGYAANAFQLYGCNKIIMEGIRAKLSGTPLARFDVTQVSDALFDDIDAYYADNNFTGLIDVFGNFTDSNPAQAVLTIRDYRVLVESGPRNFRLLTAQGLELDHTLLKFVNLENSSPFLDQTAYTAIQSLNGVGDMVSLNFAVSTLASKFFTNGLAVGMAYLGQEAEYFLLEIEAVVSASLTRQVQFSVYAGGNSPQLVENFGYNYVANEPQPLKYRKPIRLRGNEGLVIYAMQTNGNAGETNNLSITNWRLTLRRM